MTFILKVVTLNLFNLRNDHARRPERTGLVVQGLLAELPHLAGLQEVCVPADQAQAITTLLNGACRARGFDARYELRQQPKLGAEGREEAVAVLSRLPVEQYDWLDLMGGDRVAQRLRVRLPEGRLVDFYNTHLHHERGADEMRRQQAGRLLEWIGRQSASAYPILVGDMNSLPDSPAVTLLKGRLCSAYALVQGEEPEYTFPTPLTTRTDSWRGTIDYIFVAPHGGQVLAARRALDRPAEGDPTLYPSDHFGLAAEVAF